MTQKRHLMIAAGLATALLSAAPSMAQPTTTVACDDATVNPNPVYMVGSSAFEPTLKQLAVQIKAKHNLSIIYSTPSSCTGAADIADPTQVLTGTADYYTVPAVDAGTSGGVTINTCTLAAGTKPLIGVSDVFYDSCVSTPMPATMGEWQGPVQSMLFVVPKVNVTSTALSYLQAAAIFGCGAKGQQAPFIVDTGLEVRSSASGTQTMIGAAIDVPAGSFKGVSNSSGGNLVTALLALPDPQSAIGILAADAYDPKRSTLNSLAFQGKGQLKAYYPDSSATTVDKKNVRDGHYVIQGPLHFFTGLTNGQPSPTAKQVLDYLTGTVPIDASDTTNTGYVSTVALAGDVPQCAMKVKINKDGGLFSPFTPAVSCNCFFDATVTKSTPAGCVACTSNSQCTGGKRCQTGYCE